MKTAIYIEDGIVQLVLTPESDFEKKAIKSFQDKTTTTKIFNGSFYDCRGGWARQTDNSYASEDSDSSLILRIENTSEQLTPPTQENKS